MINQFVTSNWYLFAALIAILGLLAFDPIRRRSSGIRPVSAIQLPQLMNHDNAVIVDVRDNTDFENSHIAKAINIPINQLKLNLARLEKYRKKETAMVLVCRSGQQATRGAQCCVKRTFPTSTPLMVE